MVVNDNYHESQLLNAAKDFHDATFAFDKLESESVIGTYKQEYTGGGTGDSYGLGHVNLANAYSDLLWDGLKPTVISDVNTYIKEIDVNYAVIEMEYKAMSITSQDVMSYYTVKEFYKISYRDVPVASQIDEADGAGTDGIYFDETASYDEAYSDEQDADTVTETEPKITMLSYDRYVDEYFDKDGIDAINNVYEIGIVSSDDLEYRYTEDNKKIAFVRNGQLWMYDYGDGQITLVYGSGMDDHANDSNTYADHDMNIISFDKDGNMTFAVYGYMNSGDHEG